MPLERLTMRSIPPRVTNTGPKHPVVQEVLTELEQHPLRRGTHENDFDDAECIPLRCADRVEFNLLLRSLRVNLPKEYRVSMRVRDLTLWVIPS